MREEDSHSVVTMDEAILDIHPVSDGGEGEGVAFTFGDIEDCPRSGINGADDLITMELHIGEPKVFGVLFLVGDHDLEGEVLVEPLAVSLEHLGE